MLVARSLHSSCTGACRQVHDKRKRAQRTQGHKRYSGHNMSSGENIQVDCVPDVIAYMFSRGSAYPDHDQACGCIPQLGQARRADAWREPETSRGTWEGDAEFWVLAFALPLPVPFPPLSNPWKPGGARTKGREEAKSKVVRSKERGVGASQEQTKSKVTERKAQEVKMWEGQIGRKEKIHKVRIKGRSTRKLIV